MKKLLFALCLLAANSAIAQYKFTGYDIFPGTGNASAPANFMTVGGRLYFTAYTSGGGTELYTINPPFNMASMVKDINPGSPGSDPSDFFEFNGKLVFSADDGNTGKELWITDGTAAGTQLIQDILFGTISSVPHGFCVNDGKLYFAAKTLTEGEELWVTDGTNAGTHIVKDITLGNNSSFPTNLYSFNNTLYFGADDGTSLGTELWKSDGTSSGTVFIKDIFTGIVGSNPQLFVTYNSKLYFVASSYNKGEEWWTTDGTSLGTTMILDLGQNLVSGVQTLNKFVMVFNNAIYFNGGTAAVTGATGAELYKTDGTAGGTVLVKEMTVGAAGTLLSWPLVVGNKLYFNAEVAANGKELWVTDGSTANTSMVSDIITGSTGSNPSNPVAFNNKVFFAANNTASDRQLFLTDGTAGGTKIVTLSGGLTDALNASFFNGAAVVDTMLFFAGNYDSKNAELWMIEDTIPSSGVQHVVPLNTISVYPNPNNGSFTVQFGNAQFKNGSVIITDLLGREVYSQSQILNSEFQITLHQPKGIYLVKLKLDEAVITKRIVVE